MWPGWAILCRLVTGYIRGAPLPRMRTFTHGLRANKVEEKKKEKKRLFVFPPLPSLLRYGPNRLATDAAAVAAAAKCRLAAVI